MIVLIAVVLVVLALVQDFAVVLLAVVEETVTMVAVLDMNALIGAKIRPVMADVALLLKQKKRNPHQSY